MKIKDCSIGMEVFSKENPSPLIYTITAINANNSIDVSHNTGEQVMRGGQMVPLVFEYKNCSPRIFVPRKKLLKVA